jgi:all-trans-8'-apo-beta-carotenal 15,15'-oxygenase
MQPYKSNLSVIKNSSAYEDWLQGYQSVPGEFDYWIDDVEGDIPTELNGTLFVNGPGLLDINGQKIQHPFDGDGMIYRITFDNGRAHFRNRFIHTKGYLKEKKAGKILYNGFFGTKKTGNWWQTALNINFKNTANTNVVTLGNNLLALWEGGKPYYIEPHTLNTLGEESFNNILSFWHNFSAHPRIEHNSVNNNNQSRFINFCIKPGIKNVLTVLEMNINGKILDKYKYSFFGIPFIHDFVITPNNFVFFLHPITFNFIPFLLGICSASNCLSLKTNQPTQIIIIQRQTKKVKVLKTYTGFIMHHVNAFEVSGKIIIDSIVHKSLPSMLTKKIESDTSTLFKEDTQIQRFTLNLKHKTVYSKVIENRFCEFPSIHPHKVGHPYRYLYITTPPHTETSNTLLQAYMKLDIKTGKKQIWNTDKREFVSEPIFVQRPYSQKEDDGWIIGLVYNAASHRSHVVILDARDFKRDVIARLHLKHHVPHTHHGSFTSKIFINRPRRGN